MILKHIKIRSYEFGLYLHNGELTKILTHGTHRIFDPWGTIRVDIVSQRNPWIQHEQLDVLIQKGLLTDRAEVIDLNDNQRGLVWIEGRFSHILAPGLHAYWTGFKNVRVEVIDIRQIRLEHPDFKAIVASPRASGLLDICSIERNHVGVSFCDGSYVETLPPGQYAYWKSVADSKLVEVDMREQSLDVSGQEIMTADKVTLRMNALVTYRITDARKAVMISDGARQSLYREAQLALRAVVGTRDLDALLADKDVVSSQFEEQLRQRAEDLGAKIVSVGVRDVILPGDMKDLMNKVTEARKAAQANLIARREETAAMRSQANTARLLADNPTLMRLRELEVLEKVATTGNLNVMLGEKGLTDRVVNLL